VRLNCEKSAASKLALALYYNNVNLYLLITDQSGRCSDEPPITMKKTEESLDLFTTPEDNDYASDRTFRVVIRERKAQKIYSEQNFRVFSTVLLFARNQFKVCELPSNQN
jgi:vancomycin permeability regulator SanA